MIIRNGVRSTLRSRGRTILFTLLIFLLTVSLALGLGMWAYCAQTLTAMDEAYTSIALVEYMGEDYPETDAADEYARQAAQALDGEAVAALDGVALWEASDQALASLDGYQRDMGAIPFDDYAVVVASSLSPMAPRQSVVTERDLSCRAILGEDNLVYLYGPDGELQAQAPYFEYGVTRTGEQPGYYAPEIDEDGGWVYQLVAEEDLPEVRYVLDTTSGSYPYQGRYYGPDLGWDVSGYMGYVTGNGQYMVYDVVYTGSIREALYVQDGRENMLAIFEAGETGFVPERGKQYLLHGSFMQGTSNTTFAVADFYEGCGTPPYLELSGTDDPALTDSIFTEYAEKYQMANNYIRLEASDDIAALEAFQQGALFLEQGRFPQAGEAGVCVIDGRTAAQMSLSLGDTVALDVLASAGEDRFDLTAGEDACVLEVVGVTNPADDYSGCLWVSSAEGGFGQPLFGYQLGRAVLENAQARQTADAIQAMVPDGARVTLYDQGYSTAAQPLQAMESTAMAVTAACAAGVLVVLFLFGYLFVGRQRETVSVLVSLGTPAGKIRLWLLSGAAVVAGAAALAGAVIGGLSLGGILQAALSSAQSLYAVDQRYSEAAIGVARDPAALGQLPRWPAAAAGLAVFVAALTLCLFFLRQARKQTAPKRGRTSVRVPKGGTSTAGGGAPRFAMLSARRGGWRSTVVPAAALVLALLLGLLSASARGWSGQIDQLYRTAQLTGQVTSGNGRQSTNLLVSAPNARLLWDSGMLSELSVSLSWNYWFEEEMPAFGAGGYAEETRAAWIAQQPELVALNGLSAAPAFYYGDLPEVEWLEGWDQSFLGGSDYYSILRSVAFGSNRGIVGGEEWLTYPCLVSRSFLTQRGLALGDTFETRVRVDIRDESFDVPLSFQIVGAYSGSASQREIYVPLSFWFDPAWITEEAPVADGERVTASSSFFDEAGRDAYFYSTTNFSTCRFTLASPRQLDDFRDYLEEESFSRVGRLTRNRTTVVLRDQSFVETVGGLGRYVTFSQILLPVLCAAVGLLGFIISWLMVNSRRMEFAIMRGLGASRGRVFRTFFLEQAGLALLGCVLGGVVLTALGSGWAGWLAAGGFLACYLIGCALAVLAVGRTKLMSLLSERE